MSQNQRPKEYVNNNSETLVRIIKHSPDTFTRSLALAALVEYGEDPSLDAVIEDLEQIKKEDEDAN